MEKKDGFHLALIVPEVAQKRKLTVSVESVWYDIKNILLKVLNYFTFLIKEFGPDETPVSESEFTLPLLSRSRRSLELNNTKVMTKLNQQQLEQIISELNRTLSGTYLFKYLVLKFNNIIVYREF